MYYLNYPRVESLSKKELADLLSGVDKLLNEIKNSTVVGVSDDLYWHLVAASNFVTKSVHCLISLEGSSL